VKLSLAWKKWLDGLADTLLGGALASVVDLLTSPAGEFHWKLILAACLWNLKSYVKEHPRPSLVETTTTTTTATSPPVTADGVSVKTTVQETVQETVTKEEGESK